MPPGGTSGGGQPTTNAPAAEEHVSSQLAMLVPTFEPGVDDVNIWSGKVELLLSTWPKTKIAELGTRLILGCRGSLFLKLQLYRDEICVNDPKGIKKLVSLVGGSWGQIPLERKFELAEKALYKCIQKGDESSDSYLTRCDVVWTELLARQVKLEELQAYIMLRGSRLSPDDKKRVIVDSGAESGGSLEMAKVTAAVRMLGSSFFQEMSGVRREKTLKVYDHNAFLAEEPEDLMEQEAMMTMEDSYDEESIEALAAEHDEDATMVLQFEDAVMDAIAADQELSTFFSSYQDARRRLAEKGRVRGFWPVRKSIDKGKKGGKGKGKGRGGQSLASRIANSYCRICFKRGHWKDECPSNPNKSGQSSSSPNPMVAPTSFAEVNELPTEIAHLPFVAQVPRESKEEQIFFGTDSVGDYKGVKYNVPDINLIKGKLCTGIKQCLRRRRHPSEAIDSSSVFRVTAKGKDRSNQKEPPSCKQTSVDKIDHKQVPEDICFASTGTTGVVDLGASQTVIGSRQIPELLERLPLQIRNQVKRTNCNLIFRFGNHQTLTSRHALLLPIADTWFRIAIVEGNTPFLLSSDFLRKTLKAIIDTDKGTIWSKALNREIEVEITPKNLFLMDLVQIWEPKENALPVLASQVQVTTKSQEPSSDVKTKAPGSEHSGQSEMEVNFSKMSLNKNIDDIVSKTHIFPEDSQTGEDLSDSQCQVAEHHRESDPLGPSSNTHRDIRSDTKNNHVISVPALQELPEESQDSAGNHRAGDSAADDSSRTESGEDCIWQVQTGDELRRGFHRWRMDGLVHRKLREIRESGTPEVHPLCRATSGHGDSIRSCRSSEAATDVKDDCNQEQGSTSQSFNTGSSPVSELMDTSRSRGVRGRDTPVCPDASRRRSVFHEAGESPAEPTPFGSRGSSPGGDCPSEEAHCQGGTVKAPSDGMDDLTELNDTDVDFEFLSTTESRNYHRECQRWIKKLTQELEQVMSENQLFPKRSSRLDILEVMCSADSEITKQANHLGARAARFGLAQGDLQEIGNRRKLFQTLVHHRPESVWFSPECAPWCAWSRFNCSKSEELAMKILNQRWENLWQLALAVVLFRFQQVHGRHFHLEQPLGSDMLSVPCVQSIVQELSWCCFDMCRLGNLRDPRSQEPIRKRLIVCTSSAALHRFLHGKLCVEDHIHRHVAGSIMTKQGSMPTSRFTEKYPTKFARQVVKVLLQEKPWERHVLASQAEEDHPTKRRRLGMKASPAEIAQMFPCVNWQTALKLADSQAPRVGILVLETGDLLNMVQKLCPDHDVRHLVLCRGTDRYVGPCKTMIPGEAPLRKRVCIRRRFEDIHVDEEWEAWERLTQKGLRRTGVAARVSLTIFATAKHRQEISTPYQESASADAPIVHERPDMPESSAKRRCQADDTILGQPTIPQDGEVRQTVDLNSNKHGPLFHKLNREDQNWLLKLHRNLGHPGNAKLTQYCRQLGCPDAIVSAIEHLRCSTCQETAKPSIARPSAIHEIEDFGDTVSMDGVTWTNQQGRQFHFYHFVCHGTAFQTAVCAPVRSSEMAIRAFMQGWVSWAGPPGMLCIDAATELNSEEFQVFAQKHNICVRTIATDAHWQNSRAERHGGILQEIIKKMDTEESIDSYEQLEVALGFATSVKNQWSRHRGYPPEVLVFGKQRNIPASINSDTKIGAHSLAQSPCSEGTKFRKEIQVREMAQKAFVEVDNSQTMRRAILQRSRPPRENYQKGQWVMMWRRRGESQGSWIGPAQIIIQESSQVAWVSMGSKLYRVAPEHLRLLSAMEEQNLGKENMNVSTLREINQGVTQYQDLLSQGSGRNETEISQDGPVEEHPVGRNNTEEGNGSTPENNENDQPDHEPSVVSVPSSHENNSPRETTENTSTNPVEVPVPDTDELFAEETEAFVCQSDQVWKFEIDITDADIQNWKSEPKPEEMAFIVSAAKKQRAEVRLAELNAEDRKLFESAKAKEIDSWIATETVAKILRHKVPKENIMKCRWILTWKPIDEAEQEKSASKTHPKHKPKARLVVLGFQDPEVDSIPRDSPTLTKLGRMLILQIAASSRWEIGSFDIKTAFLRGEEKSNRILGIEPPCELRDRLRLQSNEVLQLLKGAYGRVDAPFLWFMELKKALEELSFTQSPFDPCTFVLFNYETKKLDGVIGVHVDDGLCCGNERFQEKLKALEKKFPFGSRKRRDFVFTGLHIKQEPDFSIRVNQTQYVNDINPIALGKGRRNQSHDVVTEEERQGLRAVIGSLQYAAINTRPDLCHRLGLLQSCINKAKVENLLEANKLLHEAKQHSSVALWIQPIPLDDIRFVTFSDASFASEKCPDSYQGTIVMAAHKDIAINKTTWVNPIMWQSRKIQKVAVSTLSAETMALAGSTDTLMWVRLFWAWLNDATLNWRDFDKTLLQLPKAFSALPESALDTQSCDVPQKIHQILTPKDTKHPDTIATDCKSLFDLISRTAPPSCQEFRTLLQTKLIREHLQSGVQIRWVPSGAQVADSLTKAMDTTMLRECLRLGVYSLHDETEILRARSDAKSRLKWLQEKASPTTTANDRMSN